MGCCNGGINLEGGHDRELGTLASLSAERAKLAGVFFATSLTSRRLLCGGGNTVQLKSSAYIGTGRRSR